MDLKKLHIDDLVEHFLHISANDLQLYKEMPIWAEIALQSMKVQVERDHFCLKWEMIFSKKFPDTLMPS